MSYYLLDLTLFFIINSANIIISTIFILRVKKPGIEHILGILYVVLGIPTIIVAIITLISSEDLIHIISVIIYGLIIYYMFTKKVRAFFGRVKTPPT